jgi:hypothetical protein
MKTIAIVSDLHCGSKAGLTPPDWRISKAHPAVRAMQEQCWRAYAGMLRKIGHVDICVCNGDAVDGKGPRSGGTEQREPDMLEQCRQAIACLEAVKADRYLLTYGTSYHGATAGGEDLEQVVASALEAEIHGHYYLDVEGVTFDLRHAVGGSAIPHGRHTAIAREHLWNQLWAERRQVPGAQVVVRSHVHYHTYAGGPGWLALTPPALQAPGTKYGSRLCSGTVDFGIVVFKVNKRRIVSWHADTVQLANIAEVVRVP